MFLFDTDTLSQVMRPNPSSSLLSRLASVPSELQFTSSITVGELVYGAHHGPRTEHHLRQLTDLVLPMVQVLPFDLTSAETYGRLRADLERAGTPLAEPDLRIGSIALTNNLTVVTGNIRHFDRISGLQVENWI